VAPPAKSTSSWYSTTWRFYFHSNFAEFPIKLPMREAFGRCWTSLDATEWTENKSFYIF
jgi:hypothetical protein